MDKIEEMKEKAKEALRKKGLERWADVCYPFLGKTIRVMVFFFGPRAKATFVQEESGAYHDIPTEEEVLDALLCLKEEGLLTIIQPE